MTALQNLDLLSVGITIAAISILGFIVFLNNKKSITNRTFFWFTILAVAWSIFNYSYYQFSDYELVLWLLRIHGFFAIWYTFFLFQMFYVFPEERQRFPKAYRFILVPVVALVSVLTLTPFVFSKVLEFDATGRISKVANGPGIGLFGGTIVTFLVAGIISLLKRARHVAEEHKRQFLFVLFGAGITFFLHIVFNLVLPAFFSNPNFIQYGAVFIFPLIAFTTYAILRHHLLGVRVIATEILTFFLSVVVLYEVIFADTLAIRVLRSGVFLLVLSFGILLIRSVRREVEQRERMERMTAELEHVNERLKELDHLKSEFLNFASHQVKSPMATVKGFATLIEDGTYGQVSDQAKEGAHRIRGAADRLISLVNNLLDLGKIEAGKLDFTMQEMDIVKLLVTMVDEFQVLAQNKKLALSFESDKPSLTIKADAEKLRQVIQNLIDNSIKYTDAPSTGSGQAGWVKVAFKDEYEKNTVLISVMDSGRGMSPELLQKLFGRFVRDEKTKTEVMGTGLGLYIAKQIVLAHQGEIWAESEGVGKGSKFFVRLGKG